MLTIQPKDDAFCTVKRKTKSNKKRNAVECWYECSKCGHTFIHGLTEYAEDVISQGIYTSLEDMERFGRLLVEEYISAGRDNLSVNDLYYSYLRYSTMCRTQEAKAQVLKSLCNRIRFLYSADIEPEQSELEDEARERK